MLFDLRPKDNKVNLFDREDELSRIIDYVSRLNVPITIVLGLRRVGKSSLILVALKELNMPAIYIDLRKFEEHQYLSYRDFILELQRNINELTGRFPKLINFLKGISGVSIMGNQVLFSWKSSARASLAQLLDALNDWASDGVIIVLDEAQELIKARGFNILPTLAYAYDNLRRIRFIVSGSKMGLLYRFLKIKDPGSPLFGRAMGTIELTPFTREQAIEFLRRGFSELNIEFRDYDEVYGRLGGIPGWLTYFGLKYYESRDLGKAINEVINYAAALIRREFDNFLIDKQSAKDRYLAIMRMMSNECVGWGEVKRGLEAMIGMGISDSRISEYLRQLLDSSWVIKVNDKYCPAEPLIGAAFKA